MTDTDRVEYIKQPLVLYTEMSMLHSVRSLIQDNKEALVSLDNSE